MTRRSTGVSVVDRRLGGGLPAGSLTALVAPPESQSELFLRAFAASGPTRLLSTLRPAADVRAELEAADVDESTITVDSGDPEALAADPGSVLDPVPEGGRLVVDPINAIERLDAADQRAVYAAIAERLEERDAVGIVHALSDPSLAAARTRTLAFADVVCRLQLTRTSLSIDNRPYVTKFRSGTALTEPIKVKLTDRVSVDTSRDIA